VRRPPVARDVDALLLLPKAQVWAVLEILTDFDRRAHRIDRKRFGRQGGVIERCGRYYTPSGTISIGVADAVFRPLMALLGATATDNIGAALLGFTCRRLLPGQGYGDFWILPDPSLPRKLLTELSRRGWSRVSLSRGEYAAPIDLPAIRRGGTLWTHCQDHDDRSPSAQVNPSGLVWCYACGRIVGRATPNATGVSFSRLTGTTSGHPDASTPSRSTPITPGATPAPATLRGRRGVLNYGGTRSTSNAAYSWVTASQAGSPGALPDPNPLGYGGGPRPTGIRIEDEHGATVSLKEPMPYGRLLGRRYGDANNLKRGQGVFKRGYSSVIDVIDLLRAAQRSLAGKGAMDRAIAADVEHAQSSLTDHRHFLPDLYVSLDLHAHAAVREFPKMIGGKQAYLAKPEGFTYAVSDYVGGDYDAFTAAPVSDDALIEVGKRIEAAMERHPCFSGRIAVVRTSHLAFQVVFQLACARRDLDAFYADRDVRAMLAALDEMCLREARDVGYVGGHADPTVHAAGRYVRRPGPRKTKQGTVYVSRLVYATP
jgi:hypothetical protein